MGSVPTDSDLRLAARALVLDGAAAAAIRHLSSAGVDAILLKGAAIASWLYDHDEVRSYTDVDLLVSPSQFRRATEVLAELGYTDELAGAHPGETGPKERDLVRADGARIDLHLGFVGVPGDPQRCWDVLNGRTAPLTLRGGATVRVLDVGARAMHLALHVAQDGPIDVKALEDLRRGLERLSEADWVDAARLAAQLDATAEFSAGLRLLPAGRTLAERLSLPRAMSVELALRVSSAPQDAIFFEWLRHAAGPRRKAALVLRKLFPTAVYLRTSSELARRSATGLLVVRFAHPFSIMRRLIPALAAWIKAREVSRRSGTGAGGVRR